MTDVGQSITWLAPAAAVCGVLLGGGIKAALDARARLLEAQSVLNALVAEVDSVKRLIEHRAYIPQMVEAANACRDLVEAGRGAEKIDPFTIDVKENYFQIFDALAAKIGSLHPYHSDRIVRFYTLAKAAKENFSPASQWVKGPVQAKHLLVILENDIELLRVVFDLGSRIASFVERKPPKGIDDPMILTIPTDLTPDPLAFRIDQRTREQLEKHGREDQ